MDTDELQLRRGFADLAYQKEANVAMSENPQFGKKVIASLLLNL